MIFLLQRFIIINGKYVKKEAEEREKAGINFIDLLDPDVDKTSIMPSLKVFDQFKEFLTKELQIQDEQTIDKLAGVATGHPALQSIIFFLILSITAAISFILHYITFKNKATAIISTILPALIYIVLRMENVIRLINEELPKDVKKNIRKAKVLFRRFIKQDIKNKTYYKIEIAGLFIYTISIAIPCTNILRNGEFANIRRKILTPFYAISHLISIAGIPYITGLILKQPTIPILAGSLIFLITFNIVTGIIHNIVTAIRYKLRKRLLVLIKK